MEATRKHPAGLMLICLAAAGWVWCSGNSVWSQGPRAESGPRVKELQRQRLEILQQVFDAAQQSFRDARSSFEDVHQASVALLAARLESADTPAARIKACDEAVEEAQRWRETIKAMVESGRATRITELKAQAHVLETQIARERADTGK